MSFIFGLDIEGYKLFSEKVNFHFAPITILTGKNNSGKSTLSSALMMMSKIFPESIENSDGYDEICEGSIDIDKIIDPISNDLLSKRILYFKNILPYKTTTNQFSFEIPVNIGAFTSTQKLKLIYDVAEKIDDPLELNLLEIYNENIIDGWLYKITKEKDGYYQQINYRAFIEDFRNFYNQYMEIQNALNEIKSTHHIVPNEERLNEIKNKAKEYFGDGVDIIYYEEEKRFIIYDENLSEFIPVPAPYKLYSGSTEFFDEFNIVFGVSNPFNLLHPNFREIEKSILNFETIKNSLKSKNLEFSYKYQKNDSEDDFLANNNKFVDFLSNSKIKIEIWENNIFNFLNHKLLTDFLGVSFEKGNVRNRLEEIIFLQKGVNDNFLNDFGKQFLTYCSNSLRNVFKYSLCFSNVFKFNISDVELVKNRFVLLDQSNNFKEELINLIDDYKSKEYHFICNWMKKFETGEAFKIERDENLVRIKVIKGNEEYLLSDNGFGHSKILPLLFKIVNIARSSQTKENQRKKEKTTYKPSVLILEEPEIGLHPALQSLLAELFYDAFMQFNIQFIVETHSEYMVRKYQEMIVNPAHSITKDYVQIHYFFHPDSVPEGEESQVFSIEIEEDGALTRNFGKGFYDESSNLNLAVYNYSKINQN